MVVGWKSLVKCIGKLVCFCCIVLFWECVGEGSVVVGGICVGMWKLWGLFVSVVVVVVLVVFVWSWWVLYDVKDFVELFVCVGVGLMRDWWLVLEMIGFVICLLLDGCVN